MRHLFPVSLSATVGCFLAACGGGGGGTAAPAYDLTGYWQLFLTPAGAPEVGPLPVYLGQTGSAIDGVALTGSMSGASFSVQADAGAFTIGLAGTASSADSAAGTVTLAGAIVGTGTFHLERYQPMGTMSVSGTLDGTTLDLMSSNATCMRSFSDTGLTTLRAVTVILGTAAFDIQIELAPAGLAIGTLSVPGTVTAQVLCRSDTAIVSEDVTSGTLTITRYNINGIMGSYSLTTAVGTITGSFDVMADLASYDP
ncbi:MAG TPA: hypothetical protein VFZ65_01330 [Planctomycetota bacterium]|nr:hypothetical protein [Planctomycetota bacterium]